MYSIKQFDKIKGSQVYGKHNKREGQVIGIDREGIVWIRWNDGQVAKFWRKDIQDPRKGVI